MKRFAGILLILLGLPFLACGLWLLGSLLGALMRLAEVKREWVTVPATIIAHEQIAVGRRGHRPTVRYAYEFEGVRHESTRHDVLQAFPVVSSSLGRREKLPYAVGQTVTAHVDPKEPLSAFLSLELRYASLLGPGGLLFLLIGVALLIGPPLAAWRRSAEARDRERGIVAPRYETSQAGLGAVVGVAFLITLMTGLVLSEARAWSVPAGIVVVAFAAGSAWLASLFLRERARRRAFSGCILTLSGGPAARDVETSWTLSDPGRRLSSPSFELAFRDEVRSMQEDGPGPWTGGDLASVALASASGPEGWRGTLRLDGALPPPADEPLRRRYWVVRIREGAREAQFPL